MAFEILALGELTIIDWIKIFLKPATLNLVVPNAIQLVCQIKRVSLEHLHAWKSHSSKPQLHSWIPLPQNCFKLNFDVAIETTSP